MTTKKLSLVSYNLTMKKSLKLILRNKKIKYLKKLILGFLEIGIKII